MPRRADLVLRTKSLQDFLPLDHLKWLSLAEAVEYNSEDFYVSGTIVKIYPIVLAKSSAWNYKDHILAQHFNLGLQANYGTIADFAISGTTLFVLV